MSFRREVAWSGVSDPIRLRRSPWGEKLLNINLLGNTFLGHKLGNRSRQFCGANLGETELALGEITHKFTAFPLSLSPSPERRVLRWRFIPYHLVLGLSGQ